MNDEKATGISVLNQMASGIMERKQQRATKLTPIVGEAGAVKATGATGDEDMFAPPPRHELWAFVEALKDVVRMGEALLVALPASNAGPVSAVTAPAVDAQKAKEQAADAKHADAVNTEAGEMPTKDFAERYAALQAAAQASLDKVADSTVEGGEDPEETPADGWACPKHGKAVNAKSPKGREFRACPLWPKGCTEFERL